MREVPSLVDRLVGACFAVLLGCLALYGAVQIIRCIWPWLAVAGRRGCAGEHRRRRRVGGATLVAILNRLILSPHAIGGKCLPLGVVKYTNILDCS